MNILPISETYLMDCVQGMKEYPDKYFDLAIVDPPYGIGFDKYKKIWKGEVRTKHQPKKWDNEVPTAEYFLELFRVSKNQIIWGGNYFDLPPTKCFIVWDKQQHLKNFAQCEMAWTSFRTNAKIFKRRFLEPYECNIYNKIKRIHPTQKSIFLYEWCLSEYAQKGDKILDTHLGSGSSRIAAHNLGFDFYGFEIDTDYYEASEKRFNDTISTPLFDTPVFVPQQLVLV